MGARSPDHRRFVTTPGSQGAGIDSVVGAFLLGEAAGEPDASNLNELLGWTSEWLLWCRLFC